MEMTTLQKYREMVRLYQTNGGEKDALILARDLMLTASLSASKMGDVEHVYFACGGK